MVYLSRHLSFQTIPVGRNDQHIIIQTYDKKIHVRRCVSRSVRNKSRCDGFSGMWLARVRFRLFRDLMAMNSTGGWALFPATSNHVVLKFYYNLTLKPHAT